ncbi:MAG TPA: hypothetical protein VHE79_03630 [Spirochaetia bacterium]
MAEITAHDVRARILTLLSEGVEGPPARQSYFTDAGPAGGMVATLNGVDAAEASRPVGGSSIAQHVFHTGFALEVATSFMRGENRSWDWKASWATQVVDEPGWAAMKERLVSGYRRFRRVIEERALTSPEAASEAIGQVAHVAYHLGAIRQKIAVLRDGPRGTAD